MPTLSPEQSKSSPFSNKTLSEYTLPVYIPEACSIRLRIQVFPEPGKLIRPILFTPDFTGRNFRGSHRGFSARVR